MRLRRLVGALMLVACAACSSLLTDLTEYGEVEVTTSRLNGEPVPGARLELFTGQRRMAVGQSDAEGRHVFGFVPPNTYGVFAEPPAGFVRVETVVGGGDSSIFDGMAVAASSSSMATFTYLKVGPGRITVDVRDTGLQAVPGASVELFSSAGVRESLLAGAGGQVTFDPVPFGLWGISVEPGPLYTTANAPTVFQDGIVVEEGSDRLVAFSLRRCAAEIVGVVRDETGRGVPGFPLTVYTGQGPVAEGVTDAQGTRAFGPLPCRVYGLSLGHLTGWVRSTSAGPGFFDGITPADGDQPNFTFVVTRCTATLQVTVLDSAGSPVSGATLVAYTAEGEVAHGVSDATGVVIFSDLQCDSVFGVSVTPPAGFFVPAGRGSSFFDGIALGKDERASVTFRLVAGD